MQFEIIFKISLRINEIQAEKIMIINYLKYSSSTQ